MPRDLGTHLRVADQHAPASFQPTSVNVVGRSWVSVPAGTLTRQPLAWVRSDASGVRSPLLSSSSLDSTSMTSGAGFAAFFPLAAAAGLRGADGQSPSNCICFSVGLT